jgi:hypothetical protein
MLARAGDYRITIEIPYREITRDEHSFGDDRLEVVDYDAATNKSYRAVNLEDGRIAIQQGLEPSEADPQFHQQMVYAVASRVLENFDKALGRRLRFWGGQRLRLMPHAFQGRNAYYDHDLNAVLFGYFPADLDDPGANLPGQYVFTCLSHDIVAHEVAHAALDRLHQHYRLPTNPHVPALHEAFADIVAIFQKFTYVDVVKGVMRETRGSLARPNPLSEIGAQFGAASGLGRALRTADAEPDPRRFARTVEPHALGEILVSAVYDGFLTTYKKRTVDLIRIATGGSGRLPEGELHPDLVNRLAVECARTAQSVLMMCIRATDYLPPVDPTFSDFLRAMITADFELNRADELGLRAAMIESFRIRGIRPEAVGSLAVESLLLEPAPSALPDAELAEIVRELLDLGIREISRDTTSSGSAKSPTRRKRKVRKVSSPAEWIEQQQADLAVQPNDTVEREEGITDQVVVELNPDAPNYEPDDVRRNLSIRLHRWAHANRQRLGLDPKRAVQVRGFHPVHRVAQSGELVVEMIAKLVQARATENVDLGGLSYRAGVTLVATSDGIVRYVIAKPFLDKRENALREWVSAFDAHTSPWARAALRPNRLVEAYSSRALDGRRWRG